jgi:hypothetical protein
MRITGAGLRKSHVHDAAITRESPNCHPAGARGTWRFETGQKPLPAAKLANASKPFYGLIVVLSDVFGAARSDPKFFGQ